MRKSTLQSLRVGLTLLRSEELGVSTNNDATPPRFAMRVYQVQGLAISLICLGRQTLFSVCVSLIEQYDATGSRRLFSLGLRGKLVQCLLRVFCGERIVA